MLHLKFIWIKDELLCVKFLLSWIILLEKINTRKHKIGHNKETSDVTIYSAIF